MTSTALVEKLHAEIIIGCAMGGCKESFAATDQPVEPIERWVERAASQAQAIGWAVSQDGRVLCPSCVSASRP